jgi:hypothetical protein
MTIQIKTGAGANDWTTVTNLQIKTGAGANDWASVNKGEIKTGAGPNDWSTFYSRITNNTPPAFSFVSATPTSVTVRVIASGSDNKEVYAYRTNDSGNFQSSPASPTTSAINQTFTFSGLSPGKSYNFSSYIAFYDAEGTFVEFSTVSTLDASTASYSKTTPTTPTNTGTISSTKLSFSSSSSSNYSTNGVAAYIRFEIWTENGSAPVQVLNSSILPLDNTTASRTVQFTGLTPNTPYYCRARTYYGSPVDSSSIYSSFSSATSTYPLHTAMIPFRFDDWNGTTDTNLPILTDINAYNNGNAKIQWEWQYRTRGNLAWLGTTSFFGTEVVTGTSTSYYGQNFSVVQTREYRFRARVYYSDLGIYGPWSNNGQYTQAIRGKTWTTKTTGWISASSTTSSSNASGYSSSMGSDGNQGSIWFSYPYRTVYGTSTNYQPITFFQRSAGFATNLYYLNSNHAIEAGRPSVSTTISSLRYGVTSLSRNTTQSAYVVLTLDSATRCILQFADEVRISGSSNSAFNQNYLVYSASGRTVYLAPTGTTPGDCTSSSGGTLIVSTTAGNSVSVFGGTSNYTSAADNYFTRTDGDYGADVPLSAATGQASYVVTTSSKVSSRVTESFSANFTPSLPSGYRNAKLYQFSIRVGPTATPALSNIVVDGVYYGNLGSRTAYQSTTITPNVINDPPYNISFDIDSAYYSGDGLYYATVTEVQVYITYETLDD